MRPSYILSVWDGDRLLAVLMAASAGYDRGDWFRLLFPIEFTHDEVSVGLDGLPAIRDELLRLAAHIGDGTEWASVTVNGVEISILNDQINDRALRAVRTAFQVERTH